MPQLRRRRVLSVTPQQLLTRSRVPAISDTSAIFWGNDPAALRPSFQVWSYARPGTDIAYG
eukprot:2986862-Rhodomonas_salina.1